MQILLFNCMSVRDPQLLLPRLMSACAMHGEHSNTVFFETVIFLAQLNVLEEEAFIFLKCFNFGASWKNSFSLLSSPENLFLIHILPRFMLCTSISSNRLGAKQALVEFDSRYIQTQPQNFHFGFFQESTLRRHCLFLIYQCIIRWVPVLRFQLIIK